MLQKEETSETHHVAWWHHNQTPDSYAEDQW